MKKIFGLIFCLAMLLSVSAQEKTVSLNNGKILDISNGAVIGWTGTQIVDRLIPTTRDTIDFILQVSGQDQNPCHFYATFTLDTIAGADTTVLFTVQEKKFSYEAYTDVIASAASAAVTAEIKHVRTSLGMTERSSEVTNTLLYYRYLKFRLIIAGNDHVGTGIKVKRLDIVFFNLGGKTMGCQGCIAKTIVSDCTTSKIGALEVIAWVFNRRDINITFSSVSDKENQITTISNASTKKGYTFTGVKKLLNAGHDIVVADDRPNKYTHHFMCQIFETLTEDIRNGDDLDDLVVFVEQKDKNTGGDGTFIGYGCKNGLYKLSDTQRANDVNGARVIELASLAGQEEPYSRYIFLATDYATTKALLTTLITTPGA
jgi:hypothetical protein